MVAGLEMVPVYIDASGFIELVQCGHFWFVFEWTVGPRACVSSIYWGLNTVRAVAKLIHPLI